RLRAMLDGSLTLRRRRWPRGAGAACGGGVGPAAYPSARPRLKRSSGARRRGATGIVLLPALRRIPDGTGKRGAPLGKHTEWGSGRKGGKNPFSRPIPDSGRRPGRLGGGRRVRWLVP